MPDRRKTPPSAADSFLEWFCPGDYLEEVQGDLHELYAERLHRTGPFGAALWYWWNVFWFMRPYLLGRRESATWIQPAMWKNYLTVAVRQLRRQPLFSTINITGLALGIAACTLMLLIVREELTFDGMHADADRIVRVVERRTSDTGEVRHMGNTAGPVGPAFVESLPEVDLATRLMDRGSVGRFTLRHAQNERHEGEYLVAEQSFLELFGFPLVLGDPSTALSGPGRVVLTESAAEFYFGTDNVLGQTLESGANFGDLEVTGLMPDPPGNSHLQFSMLISWDTFSSPGWKSWKDNWESNGFITYARLVPGSTEAAVEAKLAAFDETHREPELAARRQLQLQPLTAVHFDSGHIEQEHNAGKSTRAYLLIFVAVALLIALIACINYMNLATAWALKRAREVGMRKVVGAHRGQLVSQFLGESVLIAGFALVLAMGLALALLPVVNGFTGRSLTLHPASAWPVLLGVILTTLLVGLLSGSYPAFFIARFNPMRAFRGVRGEGGDGRRLRHGLVVTQFAFSIILVVVTLSTARQFDYIQSKDLGFEQDGLITVDINSGAARNGFETMKQAFGQVGGVRSVAVSSRVPGDWKVVPKAALRTPGADPDSRVEATFMGIDTDFLETYEIELVSGRNFSEALGTDSTALIINETAARMLGVQDAAEQPVEIAQLSYGGDWQDGGYAGRVVGVARDFHFESLHEPIRPAVLGFRTNPVQSIDYFTLRVATNDIAGLMDEVRNVQATYDPETPLEANFLDQRLAEAYVQDRRARIVFTAATLLALLIACFGLFGLSAFVAEQRTKEIGIRKAMGASTGRIVLLMSGTFTRLVLVAFVIAVPAAWWLTTRWLESFAYRVTVGPGTLIGAGVVALLFAAATVGFQSWRAARLDPVRVLRYE